MSLSSYLPPVIGAHVPLASLAILALSWTDVAGAPSFPAGSAALAQASAKRGDIVFVSGRRGARGLYVMDGAGKRRKQVLPSGAGASAPSWSPDRKRIAFYSPAPELPKGGLYVVGSDGTALRHLELRGVAMCSECGAGSAPAWSPDGRWIAHSYGEAGVALRDMRTGRSRVLLAQRANAGGGFVSPAWAPNGKRLAVWSICCDPPSLDLVSLAGRSTGFVDTPFPGPEPRWELAADWSPDGRWLAVTLGGGIWKVRAAGGGAARLASGTDPAWSPDGNRIAFVSTRDGDADIYVMRADGSAERRLTNNAVADIQPDW